MNYVNYDDIANQLRGAGLVLGSVTKSNGGVAVGELYVASTKSVRCDIEGEGKKKSGAYLLHELRLDDGVFITGSYWLDHGNTSYKLELNKVCAGCGADVPLKGANCPACGGKKYKVREIPKEQLEAHKKRMAEARRQAEAEARADAERAASWANAVWLKCREITSPDEHDYLTRKKLKAAYGMRILDNHDGVILVGAEKSDYEYLAKFHGALVVPLLDKDARRCGLQFILSREKHKDLISKMGRDKQGWPKGMISQGMHYLIGGQPQGVCLVTEGFATGASLHEATNLPVAVAFAANNLLPVGEILWKKSRKRARLLYCADDDWVQRCDSKTGGCGKYTPATSHLCKHCGHPHKKTNVGVEYSQSAALATSGAWLAPVFFAQRPDDRKGDTDFNDLRCAEGEQAVGGQIAAKLESMGWAAPALALSARGGVQPQGGGESDRPDALSIMPIDDIVARFIPIDDGSGKVLFDLRTKRIVQKTQMVELMPAGARGDDIKRHPDWIERGAVYVDQIGFDPSGEEDDIKLNTWRGWPMKPKSGNCDLLLDLLDYLCGREGFNPELVKWVLRWMAYPLQHPGAKMQSAIILHGPQGTGKSTIFKVLAEIYGSLSSYQNYAVILDQKALESKYNSDWDSKLFVLAEEVINSSDKWQLKNELKELVSGPRIRIEKKFLDAYYQTNRCNMALLSNEDATLPLDNDDRRHCVIWTPPPVGLDFYAQVQEEIHNGGVQAFYHHLKNLDLGDFKPWSRPPMTEAKQALIDASRSSEDEFFHDWVNGETPFPVCPCRGDDLFSAYIIDCQKKRERNIAPRKRFRIKLAHMHDWEHRKQVWIYPTYHCSGDKKQTRLEMPGESWAAKAIQKKDYRKKAEETEAVWATRCVLDFELALKTAHDGGNNP